MEAKTWPNPPLDLGVSEILKNQEKGFDVFV
jgi:hypothetical protein